MRMILCATVLAGAVAFVSSAASLPANGLTGTYIEARTADVYTGPCFANGEIEMNGREAVFAWKIANGNWEGVNLAGLGVVGVVHADHTLGNPYEPVNPAVAVLIVDSRADAAQRQALVQFAKSQAGDLLDHIVRIDYQPVGADHRQRQYSRRRSDAHCRHAGYHSNARTQLRRPHLRQRGCLLSAAQPAGAFDAGLYPGRFLPGARPGRNLDQHVPPQRVSRHFPGRRISAAHLGGGCPKRPADTASTPPRTRFAPTTPKRAHPAHPPQ